MLGVIAAVLWERVVTLPTYTVGANGGAATTERGLTEVFSADAWFIGIGLVLGAALGLLGWRWLGRLGWPTVLIVLAAAAVTALICVHLGEILGPSDFQDRLRMAAEGDVLSDDLTLHAPAAYAAWALGAILPVLLRTTLGRDPED